MRRGRGALLCAAALLGAAAAAADDPSGAPRVTTAEERAEAVRLAAELERSPLGEQARERRELLFNWWSGIPDVRLRWCEPLLRDLRIADAELAEALPLQGVLSGGAYLIEHPEAADDPRTVWIAGVAGAVRAYRAALELRPGSRSEDLDRLSALEAQGRLVEYVEPHAAACE